MVHIVISSGKLWTASLLDTVKDKYALFLFRISIGISSL